MNLFNFSLQLNGFPIKKATETLKYIQNKNANMNIEVYIEAQKKSIVDYHLKNNPFYKVHFGKNINSSNWNSIPINGKTAFTTTFKNRLSNGFTKENIYI